MVRPVFVSPLMRGQLIEDGPRYFGSSDGWYWIVPCFGIFTNSCGANWSTKAMMPMSAARPFIAAAASAFLSEPNWKTSSPFPVAATFNGSGFAPSFSGAQNTPATVSPRARNASRTALPKSCCPMMAIFMSLCGDFLRRRGEGAGSLEAGDLRLVVADDFLEDLLGVLAERRAALVDRGRSRELDCHPDLEPLAALRGVEPDPHTRSL